MYITYQKNKLFRQAQNTQQAMKLRYPTACILQNRCGDFAAISVSDYQISALFSCSYIISNDL